ncbi:Hypothetical predicted protein [Mytilus galloprovincialis]|uniref:C-type lectin domain-containing protein n=1 Tax=Mytilus galloprovincialis TaxID=29158 RepID=A0A8B6GC27_MYTGA|nr:Hypothetical predicted protein [Mytilus galloprovincialis]
MWYLRYSNQSKSWTDAAEHCKSLNGYIFTVYNEDDTAFKSCSFYDNVSSPLWTGLIKTLSDWIEMNYVPNIDPVTCVTLTQNLRFNESDCDTPRHFICKLDVNDENNIESDDCNIPSTETTSQRSSKESDISSTEYSSTVTTDYMSTSTSSLPEYQTTSNSHSTETQTPSTSYSTENPTTPASYSTEPQTSPTSNSTERQTISTSFPTENFTVTTLSKTLSEHKQSEQFPTVIVGSVSGVMVIILIVVAVVLILVRRKKILSNKYKKHDRAEKTEKPEKDKTKGSPLPVGSSNVSGSKSDVYCDPWQSFEESQTLTNAGKKLNRQSQNPMYEMNSLQYDSYSVAGGLTKPNNTEKYENVNLDIYNHCNVGDSKMAAPQQNVYDSAAGIYSHLNHGGIEDHNEDTYDHFHGSDQDYDQFDRTLRNTEESEYSIYQ